MLIVNILIAIIIVLFVVIGCWLLQIIASEFYKATLNYKRHKETVIVLEKKFKGAYTTTTTHVRVGKVTVPQMHHHSEEYNVYVDYEGVTYRINDNELFEDVVIGEKIEVTVHEGCDRKGRIRNIYLTA